MAIGHGGEHREGAPRAARQRLHHDQRQHRQQDDHDHQHAEHGDDAGDLRPSRSGSCRRASGRRGGWRRTARCSPAPRRRTPRRPESTSCRADSPSGRPAPARPAGRRRRWRRNGGRTPPICWSARSPARHCGEPPGSAAPGRAQHPSGDEQAVEAVGDQVGADRGGDQPDRVDRLAPAQRHDAQRDRAEHGDQQPDQPVDGARGGAPTLGHCLPPGAWNAAGINGPVRAARQARAGSPICVTALRSFG